MFFLGSTNSPPHFSSLPGSFGSPGEAMDFAPGSRGSHGEVVLPGPHRGPRGGVAGLLADGAAADDGSGGGVHEGLALGDEGDGFGMGMGWVLEDGQSLMIIDYWMIIG